MGGTVELFSEVGRGTTATFTFQAPVTAPLAVPGESSLTGEDLLVVDDSDTSRDVLATWGRRYGMRVVTARTAEEARTIARELGAGFVPARKPGKLPWDTVSAEYVLEYGVDALEMHADALADGTRVLLHDDLLATGGTARALAELAEGAGAVIAGCAFLVELSFLGGRDKLAPYDVHALVSYDSE
jgi:adenine phosphoribosyltransferase